jgi:hypothetical protein
MNSSRYRMKFCPVSHHSSCCLLLGTYVIHPPPPNIDPEKYLSFTVYLNQFKKIGKKIDKSIRVDHMDRERSTTDYEWNSFWWLWFFVSASHSHISPESFLYNASRLWIMFMKNSAWMQKCKAESSSGARKTMRYNLLVLNEPLCIRWEQKELRGSSSARHEMRRREISLVWHYLLRHIDFGAPVLAPIQQQNRRDVYMFLISCVLFWISVWHPRNQFL